MKSKEFLNWLESDDHNLFMMLPNGDMVPENFHVTEVGKEDKKFMDCGGTLREQKQCVLQVWVANDHDHRLYSGKLAKILAKSMETLEICEDTEVAVEYGKDVAGRYTINTAELTPKGLLIFLDGKQTNCLAPDKCGVNGCC